MFKKLCFFIGLLDLIFLFWLLFSFSGKGDLGEAYFDFGEKYLMVGFVK